MEQASELVESVPRRAEGAPALLPPQAGGGEEGGTGTQPEPASLESALATVEQEARHAVEAARKLQTAAKAVRHAARIGNLKALHRQLASTREALRRAADRIGELGRSWTLSDADEEQLLASGYRRELLAHAARIGLSVYEQDGYLACYPSLVKVLPKERAVSIDRKIHRAIHPAHLASHLARLQERGARFNAAQFLETLWAAYEVAVGNGERRAVHLVEIYRVLTLLPTSKREYSQQEFAHDIYLLDGSGQQTTKDGWRVRLADGSTLAKGRRKPLVVVTKEGEERTYYDIEFVQG